MLPRKRKAGNPIEITRKNKVVVCAKRKKKNGHVLPRERRHKAKLAIRNNSQQYTVYNIIQAIRLF